VHAPLAEVEYMNRGFGEARFDVMYNDYVIVSPPDNPAGLTPVMRATEGFRRIAAVGGPFVSRGDSSGTHQKEMALWVAAGARPDARWHIDVGQGMEAALRVASERQAYTLTDRSTFLALMRGLQLGIVLESDEMLYNPYAVIIVAGARNPEAARSFATWITGPGQEVIGAFGREQFGRPLFTPSATPSSPEH
jgi:tungstate transport system substrate-binding protein